MQFYLLKCEKNIHSAIYDLFVFLNRLISSSYVLDLTICNDKYNTKLHEHSLNKET